ncbi:MAG: hypothetical protein WC666_01700 [Candidatus Paceibacterota bacterium]|jgi:hypothetical protein
MKKYKNISLSLIAYIIAVLSVVLTGRIKTIPYFLFAIVGIIFAVTATTRTKEYSLTTNLLVIIGILGMLYPFVAWIND